MIKIGLWLICIGIPIYTHIHLIIQSPKICSSFVDNLICFMGTGMIEAMLEPHMKEKVNATQNEVGLAFAIYAVAYTVSGVGAGYVSISKHTFNKK